MPKILVLDNDPSQRWFAQEVLEDAGFKVALAESNEQAEEILNGGVFMDLFLIGI